MAIKVYTPDKKDKDIYLELEQVGSTIQLRAVDANGKAVSCGNILYITQDGVVRLNHAVGKSSGMQVMPDGFVKVERE